MLPALFEPRHRLAHQLRHRTEIPVRSTPMDMTEVGGQGWQAAFGVFASPVPAQQRPGGEAMTHIMQTRPMSVARTPKPSLPG